MADRAAQRLSEMEDTVTFLVESNEAICEELDVYGCDIIEQGELLEDLDGRVQYLESIIEKLSEALN